MSTSWVEGGTILRSKWRNLLVAALVLLLIPAAAGAQAQAKGDSRVVAAVPAPGYPEGIAVRGNRFYISGPAGFGLPLGSAYVQAYDSKTGAIAATYPITITNPYAGMSGASCLAFGPDGALYVIEPFVGVIRMELDSANTQSVYSAFVPTGPSLLNDLVFDGDGNLYVTDSLAAAIYRIPAGGGDPELWFSDSRLAGDPNLPFGVNGIRIDKNNKNIYLSVTAESGTLDGVIYRLPLKPKSPRASDLVEFHRFAFAAGAVAGPDGIAFGKSGQLYVALAGTSEIAVLRPDGSEAALYAGPAANGSGAPLAWANPANIAFDNHTGSLLVTNHASLVPYDPALFAVFSLFVDDKGQPLH